MKLLYPLLFLLISCSHYDQDGRKLLDKSKAPGFLDQYVPEDISLNDVQVFKAQNSYVVKYKARKRFVVTTTDDNGSFLRKEEMISFKKLTPTQQDKIKTYLKGRFEKYQIIETKIITEKDQSTFIYLKIENSNIHEAFLELSFDSNGNYLAQKESQLKSLPTLN